MFSVTKLIQSFSLFLVLGILLGCSSGKSTVGGYLNLDTDLKIEFLVDSSINPDEAGAASPLFIRMYELKATTLIEKADFLDIYEQDAKTLGADLVKSHKLKYFEPGENRVEKFVLDSKTAHVALFAEFSSFKDSRYKLVFPVVANNVFRNSVSVRVSADSMTLAD